MKNLWGGTNDVSVIGYGKEQIGGEKIHWAMQNLKWIKGKKKPFLMDHLTMCQWKMDNGEVSQRRMMTKE
jgi:hypothetical protein